MIRALILASIFFVGGGNMNAAVNSTYGTEVTQQNGTVTGRVVEEMGPVTGASIVVKGTTKGTVSDIDGNFTLEGVKKGDVLVISFVGMKTQEITWNGQRNVNVTLVSDMQNLDEVVVVAYGTAKKSSMTGSATMVKSDQLEKIAGTGFAEALQGMSTGVNVVNNQGNPGAEPRIEIRGISSMSGASAPLYIVDGMPYDGGLNQINPADIESMSVLKDAAATSLYGSRAANGVVMITTKKGKGGKPTVNFRGAWGTSDNAVANPVKANPYEQLENFWYAMYYDKHYEEGLSKQEAGDYASANALTRQVRAVKNSKGETTYVTPFKYIGDPTKYVLHDGNGNPYMNPELEYVWDESDWDVYDAIFSRKLRQEYSADVSGSTTDGKTNYYLSGGYLDDLGYGNAQFYKRYSFRANATTEIFDWWKAGGSIAYSRHRQNISGGSSRAANFTTTLSSPWLRNIDNTGWEVSEKTGSRMHDYGKFTTNFFGIQVLNNSGSYWDNPDDYDFDSNMGHMVTANFFSEFKLPFNLKYRTALNIDDYWYRRMTYGSATRGSSQQAPYGVTIKGGGGSASRANTNQRSTTFNNVISGEWTIGEDHNISGMVGHEWYTWDSTYEYGYGNGIMELGKYELSNTTKEFAVSGYRNKYSLLSFFGKADYNFQNKYYISGSVRTDGSSRFHKDNRWGTFWSVGGSWRISKEAFMEDTEWIDNLALRASYGTTGNDKLITRKSNGGAGDEILYAYQGTYTADDLYLQPGLMPNTYATPDLKWESNKQWNVGLDFSFLNRINGTVEYYSRTSADLLYYKDVPVSAQVGNATGYNMNIGDLRNSGLELTLNASIFNTKDFGWDISANMSTLKNEIVKLPTGSFTFGGTACTYKLEEGGSLYEFIAPQYDGINPENGLPGWLKKEKDANGNWTGNWVRTETRSELTTDDYVNVGSSIPNLFGSITNNFRYKGFDLSFMFYYSYGAKMSDYTYKERIQIRPGVGAAQELLENRWKQPGDTGVEIPRFSLNDTGRAVQYSSNFVVDNHYWRLRNLTLGYTLPKSLTSKFAVQNLRLYVTGNNLLTFGPAKDHFSEPETGVTGNSYNGNADTDNGIQGSRRVYMFGIQLTL